MIFVKIGAEKITLKGLNEVLPVFPTFFIKPKKNRYKRCPRKFTDGDFRENRGRKKLYFT